LQLFTKDQGNLQILAKVRNSLRVALFLFLPCALVLGSHGQEPTGNSASGNSLKQLTLEQLGNVQVTTVSKEREEVWRTPAAIYVITQEDIGRSGARTLPDALRLAPGVEVAQIDGDKWAIGIRGFQGRLSKSVLVLIDGRSVYTPLFAGVYWEMQDTLLSDVDHIEVIRGPGGTIWGSNAVNGVINIITKSAKATHGTHVSVGGGNVDQGFASARYGGARRDFNYRVYGKWFTTGPEFHADGHNFDAWRSGRAGFRTDWDVTSRDSLTIQGDAYGTVAGQRLNISFFNPPALVDTEGTGHFYGQNVVANWRRSLNSGSDLKLQVYFDRTDRRDLNYREIRNTFDADFIHHLVLPRQNLIWGLGIRTSPSHFFQTVPSVDFEPHHQTYNIFSGFVQDEIEIVPNHLFLTVGSKLEPNSFSGFEVQPSGRLLWAPSAHQTFWTAVTRAVRTPSRIEDNFTFNALAVPSLPLFLRLIGDGNFSSEQLVGYEAGYRQFLKPNLYLDIDAFYNNYDDLLSVENRPPFVENDPSPTHLVLPLFLRNGVDGITRGAEISPVWQPFPWWQLKGSYSFMHLTARNQPTSDDASTVRQLEGDSPQHNVTIQSSWDISKSFQADIDFRYVSSLPDLHVAAYSTADARLGWRIGKGFDLSLVGQNLFQPRHAEYGGDPGPLVEIRRGAYVKLTWSQ
jgi:iron complex outermembrane receptor protein